jgi:hypothetical protein
MSDKIAKYMAANKYTNNMAKFKYLEMALRNKSCIHKEIMKILNWENAYCHSSQKLLFSWLLSKNIKSKIFKIILFVIYGCEILSLTFRKEVMLRVSKNSMLGKTI